ncbi:MAG: hypothetical protein PHV46_04220, partial [Bacteroidales bacterium]|nr:hypothetical protein [Bacteroidales bacterium]
FSYEHNSMTNMFPVEAQRVKEILRMNSRGVKCESLMPVAQEKSPEFVTAVGDDSITRFDDRSKINTKRKKSKRPLRKNTNGNNNQS